MPIEDFKDVPSSRASNVDREPHALLDHANLVGFDVHFPELRGDVECTFLWDDQEVAIAAVKSSVVHRRVASEYVDDQSVTRLSISRATNRVQSIDEIDFFASTWQLERIPAKLAWIRRHFVEVRSEKLGPVVWSERLVYG